MLKPVLLGAAALAVGLGLGLLYTWVISPLQYVNTAPSSLRADFRASYVALAARAYAVDGDLGRAQTRLALLGLPDPAQAVDAQARQVAASGDTTSAEALASLASALGAGPGATGSPEAGATATLAGSPVHPGAGSPPARATPSATARRTATPHLTDTVVPSITPRLLPTRTPTPFPLGAFQFVGQQLVCDPNLGQPLIQVVTEGADGKEVPGVEVVVTWDAGFDHFFTGLKPDLGLGYGDFTMAPDTEYSVHLAESPSVTIDRLSAQSCTEAGASSYLGSWLLVFKQP